MFRVQVICHHPPHQCRCRHNVQTEVDSEDLKHQLIRKPLLKQNPIPHYSNTSAKELSKYNQRSQWSLTSSYPKTTKLILTIHTYRLLKKKVLIFAQTIETATKKGKSERKQKKGKGIFLKQLSLIKNKIKFRNSNHKRRNSKKVVKEEIGRRISKTFIKICEISHDTYQIQLFASISAVSVSKTMAVIILRIRQMGLFMATT